MQNNTSLALTRAMFPAATELSRPALLANVVDDLHGLARIWMEDAQAARVARESPDLQESLILAERIAARGWPTALSEYPSQIYAQRDAPFDVDQALTSIEFLANTFNGGSIADMDIYIRTLVETAADARLSTAVLWRARKVLNRTRDNPFRLIPKELLDAAERASSELKYLAAMIEQAAGRYARALAIIERRTEIEAQAQRRKTDEKMANKRALARLVELKSERAELEAAQRRKREQHDQLRADIDAAVESGQLERCIRDLWRRCSEVRDDPEWCECRTDISDAMKLMASSTPRGRRMLGELTESLILKNLKLHRPPGRGRKT